MSETLRNLAIVGGVAILAAGGTTLYFENVQHQPSTHVEAPPPPAANPQPAAPSPAPADMVTAATPAAPQSAPADLDALPAPADAGPPPSTAPAAAEPSPALWPPGVKPVTFRTARQAFSLKHDSAAYVAPDRASPQMYKLPSGTLVFGIEQSSDGAWVIAMTEDGKAAYLPAADLGRYDADLAASPGLPDTVQGPAKVIDTAKLVVDGHTLALSGVRGEGGSYARGLQGVINTQGRIVTCTRQANAYLCRLPNGVDIAREVLLNGAAEPADDASDDYRGQADAARAARRGVWRG
jgi:hypothetical protein